MDLTREEENFCKLTKMIIEIMPKHLRQLFVAEWNAKFPSQPWANDAVSAQLLFNAIPPSAKNRNGDLNRKELQLKILSGDLNSWDPTILFYLFLYADLQLIDTYRPYTERTAAINRFRELRNSYFGHPANMSMSVDDFETLSKEIKDIAKDVFGAAAENEIDQIIHSQIKSTEYHALKKKYNEETRDYDVVILRLDALEHKFENFEEQRGRILEPVTQEAIDEVKKKYRQQYKMHEIHYVDNNSRIELKEVDINKFAVKLKINRELPTMDIFRDEVRQHSAHLQGMRDDDIEISSLTDDENRVTFVRGIAGMGKSVLAKQLTYGWANGDIYQNFRMCVMFECRDLNYFTDHEGAKLEKHEILREFLKSKVNYDLGDGEGVLFIVDGLDELFDIIEIDSIIFDLLNIKGEYGMAKVIVTGRPHVEEKLTVYNDMGGLCKVEINGLSEDQIDKYVDRFSPNKDHKESINQARSSSKGYLPIMNVPQFLNTLCCVAILMKGQTVFNNTELYCWTVYLLLKQHADKFGASTKRASDIFDEYSQTISALSEVCYNLLTKNKVIFEGSIKLLLGSFEEDTEFARSLFVDVSDNITEKYQFKHLSLMEFLSALHICKQDMKNLMEVIKDKLEKGSIEVVSFVCRLLSGFSYGGIIKEMLQNVVGLKQEVNEKQLLGDVIELLNECGLDDNTKLSRSFEIITFFLNKKFNDKEFIKSIIMKCHGDRFVSDAITTYNICLICKHLESCGWEEDDIQMAFANVQLLQIEVSKIEQLGFVAVNERFRIGDYGIELRGMKTTVNAIRLKFDGGDQTGYCGVVCIRECEFLDDEVNECCSNDRQLKWLCLSRCHSKTIHSFVNVCDWGMSCEWFWLIGLDNNIEWWERMVEMIEERCRKGDLKMRELYIYDCTTRMSFALEKRIVRCGVKLEINGIVVNMPPSSSTPSSAIDHLPSTSRPLQSESDFNAREEEELELAIALSLSTIEVDQQTKSPQSESDLNAEEELELQLAIGLSLRTTEAGMQQSALSSEKSDLRHVFPTSTTNSPQSESDLNAEEELELQLAIGLSLKTTELDEQQSPSSSENSDLRHVFPSSTMPPILCMTSPHADAYSIVDHSTPHQSLPSDTPSHDFLTPPQYPTPPTSRSPPSAGRPAFQVSTNLTSTSESPRPSSTATRKSLIPVRIPGQMPKSQPIVPGKSLIPVRINRQRPRSQSELTPGISTSVPHTSGVKSTYR